MSKKIKNKNEQSASFIVVAVTLIRLGTFFNQAPYFWCLLFNVPFPFYNESTVHTASINLWLRNALHLKLSTHLILAWNEPKNHYMIQNRRISPASNHRRPTKARNLMRAVAFKPILSRCSLARRRKAGVKRHYHGFNESTLPTASWIISWISLELVLHPEKYY